MKTTELHLALMHQTEISLFEANEIVEEMKARVAAGEDPEEVLFENGFEPDYIFDIL
jgi:hypothetical protein